MVSNAASEDGETLHQDSTHSRASNCSPGLRGALFWSLAAAYLITGLGLTDACSCILSHPQEHYCTADFAAVVNVRRQGKGGRNTASYLVKVKKEFKMTSKAREALVGQGVFYTSDDEASCGRKFEPNTRYLITGRVIGEKAWVSFCNFVQEWSTLSAKQRKGFRKLYAAGCRCKVREPPAQPFYSYKQLHAGHHNSRMSQHRKGAAPRPGHCHWETKWEDSHHDCQGLYSLCAPVAVSTPTTPNEVDIVRLHEKPGKSSRKVNKSRNGVQDLAPPEPSGPECQWVQSQAYRNCMKTRKSEADKETDLEREWEP